MIKTKNYEKTILIFNNNNEIIMRTKNVKMCADRQQPWGGNVFRNNNYSLE